MELEKFDVKELGDSCNILINGTAGSGKTLLIRDIIKNNMDYPQIKYITSNEYDISYFKNTPDLNYLDLTTYLNYSDEMIGEILFEQKRKIKEIEYFGDDCRLLLILDNCYLDYMDWRSSNMRELICNGKHYQITVIISNMLLFNIPPNIRGMFDYIVLFYEPRVRMIKKIYEFYDYLPYEQFKQLFEQYTENYQSLVIDQNNMKYYWYKVNLFE
jgi:hypothetical protein